QVALQAAAEQLTIGIQILDLAAPLVAIIDREEVSRRTLRTDGGRRTGRDAGSTGAAADTNLESGELLRLIDQTAHISLIAGVGEGVLAIAPAIEGAYIVVEQRDLALDLSAGIANIAKAAAEGIAGAE